MYLTQHVKLVGGPRHGRWVDVHFGARLVHFTDPAGPPVERDWDGVLVQVTPMRTVTYERVDDRTFVLCRTPTALGDNDDLSLRKGDE